MKGQIKMIYFDLDHTLWDFESNSQEALKMVYQKYNHIFREISLNRFVESYKKINKRLWEMYRKKEIGQVELKLLRFEITLNALKIKHREDLIEEMNNTYLEILSKQKLLVDGAMETLEYLKDKYELGILTNGFRKTQIVKMKSSGISDYFSILVSSEDVGFPKPDEKIFNYAILMSKKSKDEIVYIGDDFENDILPAIKCGIGAIWFKNHEGSLETQENDVLSISKLIELKNIF
ncbi:MAG TPA: noncanonical pyrimidine nucleotidase, YjjG family [Petrotoga sp.]|nr:noncanonical pyrimidine nucleotidase, YjjG family [Petrotoga sp.]